MTTAQPKVAITPVAFVYIPYTSETEQDRIHGLAVGAVAALLGVGCLTRFTDGSGPQKQNTIVNVLRGNGGGF